MATLIDVVDTSFDPQILKCDIPVLANFWAVWSGPSKKIKTYLEEIATEYEGQVKVVNVDIDDNPMATSHYSVLTIPTLILFKFGQPVERITEVSSKEAILDGIKPYFDE